MRENMISSFVLLYGGRERQDGFCLFLFFSKTGFLCDPKLSENDFMVSFNCLSMSMWSTYQAPAISYVWDTLQCCEYTWRVLRWMSVNTAQFAFLITTSCPRQSRSLKKSASRVSKHRPLCDFTLTMKLPRSYGVITLRHIGRAPEERISIYKTQLKRIRMGVKAFIRSKISNYKDFIEVNIIIFLSDSR